MFLGINYFVLIGLAILILTFCTKDMLVTALLLSHIEEDYYILNETD